MNPTTVSAVTRVVAADALRGDAVVGRDGRALGTIEEIVVDLQRGTAAYAVIAPVAGRGKLLAVPWPALSVDTAPRRFVLDADPERFDKAPRFDKDHWPPMADATWAGRVHDYYGVHPYWSDSPDSARDIPHPKWKGSEDENSTSLHDDCGVGARL